MAAPAAKEFANVAEAKLAMLAVINSLETKLPELQAALQQAGDDPQKKMMLVVPVLQNALATPMSQFGFPPGPGGLMQGMSAFQLITSSCLPDSADHAVLTQAQDTLKGGMMGAFPDPATIASLKAALA